MCVYLMTVEEASQSGTYVRVLPRVPARRLGERAAGLMVPMRGDGLELRLPNGSVRSASIASFGVEVWRSKEGDFYTTSDPTNPVLTLVIAGDLKAEDVPPGTEVWLSEPTYKEPTKE